jgi:hypothetical protein
LAEGLVSTIAFARPRPRRRRRRQVITLGGPCFVLLWLAFGCTSTVTPPPLPANPTTVFLLSEAMHTGLVLPPADAARNAEYVEFGYGDWGWFALGNDKWYHVFATVLWPTQGALGRRTFGARTQGELLGRVTWATLSPIVVDATKAASLRQRLQDTFDKRRGELVRRGDLGFEFVPADENYWFGNTCADVAARWLEELDCHVGWAPIRAGLETARQ